MHKEVRRTLVASDLTRQLVERYNPKDDMTQTERATMSARRVGLSMPQTPYDPSNKDGQQSS